MKFALLIPDGMWDQPVKSLGGKTPLEMAHTPNMDELAKEGSVGLVRTVPEGFHPGSDVANMSLLGYAPEKYYSGRAPLEAANLGVEIGPDEVAFRCNFVTVSGGKMLDYSAGHISTSESEYLIDDLNRGLGSESVRFYAGTSYRNLLVLKDPEYRRFLEIECVAPHDILGKEIAPYFPRGKNQRLVSLLKSLMLSSQDILAKAQVNKVRLDLRENPATMIWLWGQGIGVDMPSFEEKFGLSGGLISAVDLLKGLGRKVGLEVVEVEGATGYYDTNYRGKALAGIDVLSEKEFVMIHIEATDEAGHNGHVDEKIKAIERFDQIIVKEVSEYMSSVGGRVLIAPDHPTPVAVRSHTSDPVGFILWGDGVPKNEGDIFTEASAKATGLFVPSGEDLARLFLKG